MNPQLIKQIAAGIAAGLSLIIITTVIVSKVKDKAYNNFIKQHDEEMAKKLSESFNKRVDDLPKTSIKRFRDGVRDLCKEYGIDYALV